jgi:hypothetical protein
MVRIIIGSWRRPCSPSASLPGLWWLSVPQRARFEFEGAGTLAANPDLRLVSERSRLHADRAVTNDQPQRY